MITFDWLAVVMEERTLEQSSWSAERWGNGGKLVIPGQISARV